MPFSTLELLPNEILMLIFQYSGDAPGILRAFLGLNQRFNSILLGRELHLLTEYLSLEPLNEYYSSHEFQQATCELLSIKTTIDEEKLVEILRPLIGYSIRQRYRQLKEKCELLRARFVSVRERFHEEQLQQTDDEIKKEFRRLEDERETIEAMKRIKELVFIRGASLRHRIQGGTDISLVSFIEKWYLSNSIINDERKLKRHSQIIQILVISNPDLLNDRFYYQHCWRVIEYFLFYHLFGQQIHSKNVICEAMSNEYNRVLLDLIFLVFCCRSRTIGEKEDLLIAMIDRLSKTKTKSNHIYIRFVQAEMVKFIFEQCNAVTISLDWWNNRITTLLRNLIREKRSDIIEYLFRQPFLKDLWQKKNVY